MPLEDEWAKLLVIKQQFRNCRNSAELLNVLLVKDSHDAEKQKKRPLFFELPFKGSIQSLFSTSSGAYQKPYHGTSDLM